VPETLADVRRDPRYRPRSGSCRVVFEHPISGRRCAADVNELGIGGLSFTVEDPIEVIAGTLLDGIRFEVGDCVLPGDLMVKYTESLGEDRWICGGLFLPADPESAVRFEGIIQGLHVADGSR